MNLSLVSSASDAAIVTVVVPAYNHAHYIVEALDSVRNQTFTNWEMIVIDDGSTDDTWQVLQSYQQNVADPRIQILRQTNAGSHATINRGMAMSGTPYLAILNSDDAYAPNRLSRLLALSAGVNQPVFIVTGIRLINEDSIPIEHGHWWLSMYRDILAQWNSNQAQHIENPAVQTLLWGNLTVSTSNFFMSRAVWEQIGCFKHLRYIPDWDYALRVACELPQAFVFKPQEELMSYRLHGQNTILGGALRNHAEAIRVLREFQKKWAAMGRTVNAKAIDRLHYLNRFMRHEHTRLLLEEQKKGWIEQVQALRAELDRKLLSEQHWQKLVNQMQSSLSWRMTFPLRFGKSKLAAVRRKAKHWVTHVRHSMRLKAPLLANPYHLWLKAEAIALTRMKAGVQDAIAKMQSKPLISIVMPVHNTPIAFLQAAVSSVQAQWYEHWELCICDDASDEPAIQTVLKKFEELDVRIKCIKRKSAGHIVLATNDAIAIAQGQFIVFLDHDDLLAPQTLFILAQRLNQSCDADLIYSDEDKIDQSGQRCLPFFKPDWSPVLQWSQNYVGHLMCVRRALLDEVGGLLPGTQGSQDHDLVLRLAAHGATIEHIPQVLYHWRVHAGSTSSNPDAKPYAHFAGKDVVGRHLRSRYGNQFDRVDDSDHAFVYLPRFKVAPDTLASIVIPTLDKPDLLKACIDSIQQLTQNSRYEILVLDNGSLEQATKEYFQKLVADPRIRVIDAHLPFNWSRLNNLGRQQAKGQVLVFLNNDTVVISPDWLQRLMEYALLPDVALVGPMLLYPDDTIQHAGVVVGMGGWADHVFKGQRVKHFPSPFVSSVLPRNVLAITGACLAISSDHFDSLGGFDEAFEICGSDVELGIRAHRQGYSNVYLPTVRLYHLESKTRSAHVPEVDFQQSAIKYAPFRTVGDPFYNLNLNIHTSSPTPLYPDDHKPGLG